MTQAQIKISSIILVCCALLLSACGNQKIEPVRPEVKSSQTNIETNYNKQITVKDKKILVEIMSTDQARAQGLSDRNPFEDNQGMLFDFTNTTMNRPGFWMKDMKFNIDIIWIADSTIIDINKNVPAPKNNSNLPVYYPPREVTHVLEVSSGWCERNNIQVGDKIQL